MSASIAAVMGSFSDGLKEGNSENFCRFGAYYGPIMGLLWAYYGPIMGLLWVYYGLF